MARVRVEKLQELVKQEFSKIVLNDLKNPNIGFVTITQVELTNDLRHAKIWLSAYGSKEEQEKTIQGIAHSLGYIRSEIGKRIRLKFVPELHLQTDKSLEYSEHIQKILLQIKSDEAEKDDNL